MSLGSLSFSLQNPASGAALAAYLACQALVAHRKAQSISRKTTQMKRYKDAEGKWQQITQWHRCVAYGSAAEHTGTIQTDKHAFIEGEFPYHG
jgi:hypothetical protein